MAKKQITRRALLKSTAAAGLAAAPYFVPARVLGADRPSNRLHIGCIGTGRMGHGDMRACLQQGLRPAANARVVAVCDLDSRRAAHARDEVTKFYSQQLAGLPAPVVDVYEDFRELLARDDIDGVTISTPDHWHGVAAIAAANAGKDIHLQKPLTYTIGEGQRLVEAVRRNNCVFQTGSQQRSETNFRHVCELVRNGRLGKLHTILVMMPTDSGTGDPTPAEPPSNLNYEMWLGPRQAAPYAIDRVHPLDDFSRPGWLQIEGYCRGMITGWGSHMFDIAQWGHGSDDSGPVAMRASGEFPDRGLFDVHTNFEAEGEYADGVKLLSRSGQAGVRFEGGDGWIFVERGRMTAEHPEVLNETVGDGETKLYVSDNHMLNFLTCMRSRKDPICPVEVGHRSNSICVITHMAMKLGRALQWDPQRQRFLDDDEANSMLDYEHRAPWTA